MMPAALRLFGNRVLAARYWGEGKRLLFQLRNVLSPIVETGYRTRVYPDGTVIRVASVFGNDFILISAPFPGPKEHEITLPGIYLMAFRSPSDKRFYFVHFGAKTVTYAGDDFLPDVLNADANTALAVLSDLDYLKNYRRSRYVVSYNAAYGDWNVLGLSINIFTAYELERYLFEYRGEAGDPWHRFGYRMIERFGSAAYFSPRLYFPKRVNSAVEWTNIQHSSYYESNDVLGKYNVTQSKHEDSGLIYADSWGERLHETGYGSETVTVLGEAKAGIHEAPWGANSVAKYLWPPVTSFSARRRTKKWSLKWEDYEGTHEQPDFLAESINYAYTEESWGDPIAYTNGGSSRASAEGTYYWPIASIGNKKFLLLENGYSQIYETSFQNRPLGSFWWGEAGESRSGLTEAETLTQIFRSGDVILETLASTVNRSWESRYALINGADDFPREEYFFDESMTGELAFAQVLDFANHDGNVILFYKILRVQFNRTDHSEFAGPYHQYPGNSQTASDGTRMAEYYLATIINGTVRKTLLAVFNGTHAAGQTREDIPIDYESWQTHETRSGSHSGTGKRINSISCQMNPDIVAFSYLLESFNGVGGNEADYDVDFGISDFGRLAPGNWYSVGNPRLRQLCYPFPLEELDTLISGGEAFTGDAFVVGAVGVDFPGAVTGEVVSGSFEYRKDMLAAIGVISTETLLSA